MTTRENIIEALSAEARDILQAIVQGAELWRSTNADRNDRCWLESGESAVHGRQIDMAPAVELIHSGLLETKREDGFNIVWGLANA
jgi:hypothetical protein